MNTARFEEIRDLVAQHNKLSSDAFLAKMNEEGVSDSELEAYGKRQLKRERLARAVQRGGR